MLIQLADVHFGYPGHEIFTRLSFQVNPGDRLGLVGPNGAGKSTLLRLLSGELTPDQGQVVRTRGKTVAYLHQSQEFHGQGTLWDTLLQPFAEVLNMRDELAALEQQLSEAPAEGPPPGLLSRYGELQEVYNRQEGYRVESRIRQLAADLGFTEGDLSRPVETLSGGERGRVELAKVVLVQPDLLLLDEPTNHLDMDAVEHLEGRLREWDPGRAFVLVSHDRYFLRAACRDIVDVEGLGLVRYSGGYDRYVAERAERHERLNAAYERQQEEIARTEEFIRKNLAGQKTKQAKSRRKMLDKVERLERHRDEWQEAGRIGLQFSLGDHKGGKEMVRAQGVTLAYPGGPPLVKDLDLTIYRGERVGIIGPNGAGKTTLLKALLGQVAPRAGVILQGHEVRVGYFDQKLSGLDEGHSLIDEVRTIRGDWNEDVARAYLARFRFTGDDGFRKVRGLSGGERNRLVLAKLMLQPRNLLALDEPTNHLDIPACEVLEEALQQYEGTVLVVSHDRYFLDKVVTKILHLDPATGRVEEHAGNYSEWHDRTKAPERDRDRDRDRERNQRRMAQLEAQISEKEAEAARLKAALAQDDGQDWQRLHQLQQDLEKNGASIHALLAEWEELAARLEGAS